jgi:hypothetical protein
MGRDNFNMKLLYLLAFVVASQAVPVDIHVKDLEYEVQSVDIRTIGAPYIKGVIVFGPPHGIKFLWDPLPSPPSNPIRGYKVRNIMMKPRFFNSPLSVDKGQPALKNIVNRFHFS